MLALSPSSSKISPLDQLNNERKGLYGYPGALECFAGENYKVNKYSTISLGTNRKNHLKKN
jgi:hypothetical protein